jgi:hypothetical protein
VEFHCFFIFFVFRLSINKYNGYSPNLIGNSPMNTKILLINNASDGKQIKSLHKVLKHLLPILLPTLLLKIINLGHNPGLMITPQQKNISRIHQLHQHQNRHHFYGHYSPIHIITQKDKTFFFH